MIVYRYAIHRIDILQFLDTPNIYLHRDSLIIDHNIVP